MKPSHPPPPPSWTVKEAIVVFLYENPNSPVSLIAKAVRGKQIASALWHMMGEGTVTRAKGAGPRGGYGYSLVPGKYRLPKYVVSRTRYDVLMKEPV